ncbi:MAG: GAF domain-containing protein [Actinobacteria bacterium]|nr:GAF domain-containing protein [Actinomycetota bacterium]
MTPSSRTPGSTLALSADADHMRLAGLLRRAHTIALDTGVAPGVVRPVISDSWQRSVAAGVDPERPAPRILDARHTAARLATHPVAPLLSRVSALLRQALVESRYFVAFSDADGVLLWTEGSRQALRTAVAPRFLPGFLCSEDGVGTNAIGTALALDQPVQIYSAEHYSRLLHGWTCAAAPIHDPDTGETLGAIDLSGDFRTAHLHGLPLVTAVATAAEAWLAGDRRVVEERAEAVAVAIAGRDRAVVTTSRGRMEMNLRHTEILALLALNPAGMTVRDLALALYGSVEPATTVRAEVTRLRRRLGADVVLSRPYRLHERVSTDVGEDSVGLLPESRAPGIVEARCSLDAAFQLD